MIYQLCHSCTVVAANNDTSGLDAEDLATVAAWLEAVGLIAPVGQTDEPGYWDCDCCGWTQIGDQPTLWETM